MSRFTKDITDTGTAHCSLLVPVIVFFVSILIASGIIYRLEQYRLAIEHARVLDIADNRADLLQENINRALSATYSVAALIRQGKGSFPDFVPTISQLLPFYPGVASLDIAPGGVISAIVPTVGNEKAIGFDILNDPAQKKEAIKARDSGELTLAGPLELVEGGLGAVGRLPVFLDDNKGNKVFWGLTCVVLKFPDVLLPASLNELANEGYQYELWRIHPDSGKKQTIAASSADSLVDPAQYSFNLPNGKWTLSIAPTKGWGDPFSLMLKAFLGVMVSLIIAFAAFLLVKLKAHKSQLEEKVLQRTAELEKEVSERNLVAHELLERSEYNRALLDSISSNVAILNRDGVIISVNSAWLKFGRENSCSGELPDNSDVGGNYLDVCRRAMKAGEPFVREAFEGISSVLNGSSQFFDLDYLCDKGEIGTDSDYWYCMTVEPLKVDGGGAVVMHIDISERKRIENTLRHSETKLRTLYDSTADALMLLDETGFFDCNDATLEVFGCKTRKDFYSKHPADFSPIEQPCGANSLELAGVNISTAMKLGSLHFEWMHKRHDSGATFPADVLLSAMVLDGRTVLQATVRDISEREETNASLYKLSQAVEQSPVMIVITDVAGRIEFVNQKFTQMTGYSAEEAIGQNPRILQSGKNLPELYVKLWQTISAGNVWNGELINKNRNGDIFWERASISPLKNKTGKIINYLAVKEDITERKHLEAERIQLERQFHQAQKLESLGVLAGGIAHDFNNILTIILGQCFMAIEEMIPPEEHKAAFQMIESAGNRATDLCRQMLSYAGQSPLEQTGVNLCLLVDEVVRMLQPAIKKNVVIELDLNPELPQIRGDAAQLQQIVMNLVINASDAIGDNRGAVRVILAESAVVAEQTETDSFGAFIRAGRYNRLEVTDTGCGMDEATKKRIFEPFFTTKPTGRGLGMSAVIGIIKSHDGNLQLSSTPGVGTTFTVFFPVPESSEPVAASSTEPPSSVKTSGNILLVEDEEILLVMGTTLLMALGFSVIGASNGREALEIQSRQGRGGIDLVLLDLNMPVMGGVETYRELRKIDPTLPIIICSGYSAESVDDYIHKDKYSDFVHKPYVPDKLLSVMAELMGEEKAA